MHDFLGTLISAAVDLLWLRWWSNNDDDGPTGCFWLVVYFVILCAVIGLVVWLVMK